VYMAGAMVAIVCRMGTMEMEDSFIAVGYNEMALDVRWREYVVRRIL